MLRPLLLFPIALLPAVLFSAERLQPVEVTRFRGPSTGIAFDYEGYAYISHGPVISRVSLDGKKTIWSETGSPAGHKVRPDGTHLVCDPSRHAVVQLDAHGKILGAASSECDGKPLAEPRDLTLDSRGGFYFTDSGGARDKRIGAVYYVDRLGKTHLAAAELHDPQGIVLRPEGKMLLVAEGRRNRILSYEVVTPGRLGPMKVFADLALIKQPGRANEHLEGLCLDQHANLYIAHGGLGTVDVFSRKGRFIREYPVGLRNASGVAFGGAKLDQLFITGALVTENTTVGALLRLPLPPVKGLPLPARGKP